jgi:hypothetical protein
VDTVKQANILGYALEIGVVDGKDVIAWIDRLIEQSKEVENWMIDISMHDPDDKDGLVDLLGRYSGFLFTGNLIEYIALVGCLTTLKGLLAFEMYSNLVIEKDTLPIASDDSYSHEAVGLLRDIEDRLEADSFNDAAIKFADEKLFLLVKKSQALYPEIAEFLSRAIA